MTINEFIKQYKVEFSTKETNRTGSDFPAGSRHYACTIQVKDQKMVVLYSKGPGHFRTERDIWTMMAGVSDLHANHIAKVHNRMAAPDIVEILQCLHSDFSLVEDYDEEEFLVELGYSDGTYQQLRKGRAAFIQIRQQRDEFKRVFGFGYNDFISMDPLEFDNEQERQDDNHPTRRKVTRRVCMDCNTNFSEMGNERKEKCPQCNSTRISYLGFYYEKKNNQPID